MAAPSILKASNVKLKESTYDKLMSQVGFNHLPNKEIKNMNTVIHRANTRGHDNHGWLDTHHTFSFANYHNPDLVGRKHHVGRQDFLERGDEEARQARR